MFVCICENVRTWVSDCTTFMALICEHLYWLLYSSSMFALCSNVCKSFKLISYLQIHFAIVFRCLCRTQVELRVSRGESYTGKAKRIYTGIGLYIDHSTTFCKLSLCWILHTGWVWLNWIQARLPWPNYGKLDFPLRLLPDLKLFVCLRLQINTACKVSAKSWKLGVEWSICNLYVLVYIYLKKMKAKRTF